MSRPERQSDEKLTPPRMVSCVECGSLSGLAWAGWRAYRVDDPEFDEPPALAFYCPGCAAAEFGDDWNNGSSPTAGGQYTFAGQLATEYYLYLDTDQNIATGDPDNLGADYLFYDDHASHSFSLVNWNGSDWDDAPETTASVLVAADRYTVTASVNRSDLGDAQTFDFFVVTDNADDTTGQYADAPSGSGIWTYALQPALTLTATARTVIVRQHHAWGVMMMVTRSDTGKTVSGDGRLLCSATAGGAKLRTADSGFVSAASGGQSVAYCQFALPKKHPVKLQAKIAVTSPYRRAAATVAATAEADVIA
jgi:hypothetical protein